MDKPVSQSNDVLCAPVRTAIRTYGGSLKDVIASDRHDRCGHDDAASLRHGPRSHSPKADDALHRRRSECGTGA